MHSQLELRHREQGVMPSHFRCLLRCWSATTGTSASDHGSSHKVKMGRAREHTQAKQAAGTEGGAGGRGALPSLLPGTPVVVAGVPSLNCVGELLLVVAEPITEADSDEKEAIADR